MTLEAGTEPKAQVQQLGRKTAAGFVWYGLQTITTRLVTFVGQLYLTRLLSRADYGLFGMACSVSSLPNLLSMGTVEVLIQRREHFRRWANASFWMALAFGALNALIHFIAAPIAGFYTYKNPQVIWLVILLGFGVFCNAAGYVSTARLQIDFRFRFIAIMSFLTGFGAIVLSIVLAYLGWGPYALMLPYVLTLVAKMISVWIAAPVPFRWNMEIKRWRFLVADRFYLMGSAFFITLIGQGDNMILGAMRGADVLGLYFWAYTLALQAFQLVVSNLASVLFPSLSYLKSDVPRMRAAFRRAVHLIHVISVPFCCLQFLLAEPGIHILFKKEWYDGIPMVKILSLAMVFQIVIAPALGLMQAQARFRTMMILGAITSAVFLLMVYGAAALGQGMDSAVNMAIAVLIFYPFFGAATLRVALQGVGQGWKEVAGIYAGPLATSALATGATLFVLHLLPATRYHDWLEIIVGTLTMIAATSLLVRFMLPESAKELMSLIHDLFLKRLRRSPRGFPLEENP